MSNHLPAKTPVIGEGTFANVLWVAFNWRSARPVFEGAVGAQAFTARPRAGAHFAIATGEWTGRWVVRAHDGASPDIFFAEALPVVAPPVEPVEPLEDLEEEDTLP